MGIPVWWEPKDPDEAKQYEAIWTPGLLPGDTIVASEWVDAAGVVKDADSVGVDGLRTFVRLSGGVDGVPGSITNRVTTTSGDGPLEQLFILPIAANTASELGEYEMPRPEHLVARYPEFAAVPYQTVAIHLNDALSGVDTSWSATDYAPALSALAAHHMALLGLGVVDEVTGYLRKGVTGVRDGAFSVNFNDRRAAASSGNGFDATPYGATYAVLLRRNRGGPRLVGGAARGAGWGALGQQNDGGVVPWSDY